MLERLVLVEWNAASTEVENRRQRQGCWPRRGRASSNHRSLAWSLIHCKSFRFIIDEWLSDWVKSFHCFNLEFSCSSYSLTFRNQRLSKSGYIYTFFPSKSLYLHRAKKEAQFIAPLGSNTAMEKLCFGKSKLIQSIDLLACEVRWQQSQVCWIMPVQ